MIKGYEKLIVFKVGANGQDYEDAEKKIEEYVSIILESCEQKFPIWRLK